MSRLAGSDGRGRLVVISALGIFEILAWGSSFYLPAVLAKPISTDTGWPLPWIVGALSAGLLVAGLVSPRVGRTIGRHGGRQVLAGSACLLAAGLAVIGLSPSLPVFIAGWLLIGAGMGAGLYDAAFATLGRLYGSTARPAITTLTLWGGFASTVCWPFSAWLVDSWGWRGACLAYAAIHIVVSLPLALILIPPPPELAPGAGGPAADQAKPTAAERRALWVVGGIGVANGAISSAVGVHLLTLLQDRGLTLGVAVALGALVGPSQVAARIVEMAGRGRHHPMWTLTASVALILSGLVLLLSGSVAPAIALVLYGAGNGLFSIARGTVPLALFGAGRYAGLVGVLAMPSLIAQAVSPSGVAFVLSALGTTVTLAMLAVVALTSAGLVMVLWQQRRALTPAIPAT